MAVCPAKTQISLGIRPVWSESWLSTWRNLGSLATQWAHSEDPDQTGRMPRLIWVGWALAHLVGFVMSQLKCFCSLFLGWLTNRISWNESWTIRKIQLMSLLNFCRKKVLYNNIFFFFVAGKNEECPVYHHISPEQHVWTRRQTCWYL